MSGNGRATGTRRELDFYPTPAWMVDHLLDRLPFDTAGWGNHVTEPCVGAGNIVNAIRRRYPEALCLTNDIDQRHEADSHVDATTDRYWGQFVFGPKPEWVITNPPFSEAFDIVRQAVEYAKVGVAMLLRTTWLEPTKTGPKAAWLAEHPPKWELVMERYSFDGSGSQDSAPTAWFVWSPYLESRIEVIPGRGRQEGLPL